MRIESSWQRIETCTYGCTKFVKERLKLFHLNKSNRAVVTAERLKHSCTYAVRLIPQYPGHKTDERGSRRTRRRRSGGPGLPAPCCRQLCRGLCLRRRRSRLALRGRLLTTRPPRAPAECAAGASSPHLGRRRALAPWPPVERKRETESVCSAGSEEESEQFQVPSHF